MEEEKFDQELAGIDSDGKKYINIDEIFSILEKNKENKAKWYEKGAKYWEKEESSYDGVLGGFGFVNPMDITDSEKMVDYLVEKNLLSTKLALDCGAGIGRITKELLIRKFEKVDLVENNPKYIEKAKEILKGSNVKDYYCEGLESFKPSKIYDCIWIQWVSSYLPDLDYIKFFNKCANNLSEKGVIIVKENVCKQGFIYDLEDESVTRSDYLFKKLFQNAGLKLLKADVQTNFPTELFQVNIYALGK